MTDAVRVFFALLPDEAARRALGDVVAALPPQAGRAVPSANLHLTLVFIGEADPARLACLHARAAGVAFSPIRIRLDWLDGFARSRVWWLGPHAADAALQSLAARLAAALVPCGPMQEERPLRAHVTLSHAAREMPAAARFAPIEWQADAFALMVSRHTPAGVRYEVLARYPQDAGMPLSAGPSVG